MSDTDSAQREPRDRDPWAAPTRGIPLDGGGVPLGEDPEVTRPAPPTAPPVRDGAVPPVPLAPTGPGTPSAWQPPTAFQGPPPAGPPYGPSPYPAYGAVPPGPGSYAGPGLPYGAGPPPGPGPLSYGPVPPYGPLPPQAPAVPDNGFGTAALVLGMFSLLLSVSVVLGLVLGVLAVTFGAVGRAKAVRGVASNRGQAVAGLILGALGLAASVTVLVLVLSLPDDEEHGDERYGDDPDVTQVSDVTHRAPGGSGAAGGYAAGAACRGPLMPSASR
ncbi:DUF4190 domain-containing protein [Streptomyces sp. URMC 126]|uniref:DUF4190 domain-containing protein n=1 Tax=Streptomyces sp. URMC 126 TaxID=3423401 RepID=UPI003F19BCD5